MTKQTDECINEWVSIKRRKWMVLFQTELKRTVNEITNYTWKCRSTWKCHRHQTRQFLGSTLFLVKDGKSLKYVTKSLLFFPHNFFSPLLYSLLILSCRGILKRVSSLQSICRMFLITVAPPPIVTDYI